jgi:2-polyprenyl-3-methyl-5-hydroxy-6-metoxy-1,4-benzoquinol methylase
VHADKKAVQDFWEQASCGEVLYLRDTDRQGYTDQARRRYELEPYIEQFAAFSNAHGKRVLEIGVGLGADHQRFAEAGAILSGVDLTERAVMHARRRLELFGLASILSAEDAEDLSFDDASFDIVYSWGVIHHSPNTRKAVAEIHRVLKPGGTAKVMIYHKWSLVGYMLWLRYGLMRLRPWMTLTNVYAHYLESPGTKAYSVTAARRLFAAFGVVHIQTVLTHGDLLESVAGQRHGGAFLSVARRIWPRAILRRFAARHGLFMLISAIK